MSLFHLKEWWAEDLSCETFGQGSVVVGNIDDSPESTMKVITGSLQGRLCVFDPQLTVARNGSRMLLEAKLDAPIYQLEIGQLTSNLKHALAILHPCKLVVCSCTPRDMKTQTSEVAETCHLELLFQYVHKFGASPSGLNAYSMCVGSFGSTSDHDMIIVQSMDGGVTAYDYEVS